MKYENEGGPGARTIVDLIRTFSGRSDEDVWRFVDALAFNWLVCGTDAHAKNYSMLIGEGGRARLRRSTISRVSCLMGLTCRKFARR